MNIFYRSFAGGLMKTTNILYKTLPGLRPAAVASPRGYAWTAVGPGAIPVIGINGLHSPPKIQNLTHGLSTRVEIVPGAAAVAGQSPQERHEKIGFQQRQNII